MARSSIKRTLGVSSAKHSRSKKMPPQIQIQLLCKTFSLLYMYLHQLPLPHLLVCFQNLLRNELLDLILTHLTQSCKTFEQA